MLFHNATEPTMRLASFRPAEVLVQGTHVLDWLALELNKHQVVHETRVCVLHLIFEVPQELLVGSIRTRVDVIEVQTRQVRQLKSRRLLWSGQAMFNWSTGEFIVPSNCSLESEPWKGDMSGWSNLGDVPVPKDPPPQFAQGRFQMFSSVGRGVEVPEAVRSLGRVEFHPAVRIEVVSQDLSQGE